MRMGSAAYHMKPHLREDGFKAVEIGSRYDDMISALWHGKPPTAFGGMSGGCAIQTKLSGGAIHCRDHERDMLVEIYAQLFRAFDDIIAVDAARERLILHLLPYGRSFQSMNALIGAHKRCRHNQP